MTPVCLMRLAVVPERIRRRQMPLLMVNCSRSRPTQRPIVERRKPKLKMFPGVTYAQEAPPREARRHNRRPSHSVNEEHPTTDTEQAELT